MVNRLPSQFWTYDGLDRAGLAFWGPVSYSRMNLELSPDPGWHFFLSSSRADSF